MSVATSVQGPLNGNDCRLAERCTKIRVVFVRCVPPLARTEVPERRTGFQKSTGTPFRRVPAQFNHWFAVKRGFV